MTQERMQQTEIGEIPESWAVKKLSSSYEFTKKPRTLKYKNKEAMVFIPMEMIPLDKTYLGEYLLKPPNEISNGTYFEEGDLLIAKITPSFENGKQCIAKKVKNGFGIATTEIIPIKEKLGISNTLFLFYYLLKHDVRSNIAGKMEGATGRQRIPIIILKELFIPLPPLSEQKKIAVVLSKIQQSIDVKEELIKTTKELKKSTMQHLFTYGTKGEKTKQTEVGEIPESWKISNIDNLFNLKQGKSLSAKEQTGKYMKYFLRTSNILWGKLDMQKVDKMDILPKDRENLHLRKDDLLLCEGGDIGRTALWSNELDECYFQNHIHRLRTKNVKHIIPLFYMYWMDAGIRLFNVYGTFGNRTTIPNLSGKQLRQFNVPLPPLSEQKKIAAILSKIDERIENYEAQKSVLQALFKSMLNKLMTGQIRVHKLDIDVSEIA